MLFQLKNVKLLKGWGKMFFVDYFSACPTLIRTREGSGGAVVRKGEGGT